MVLFPPAKINIGLYITRKREDGYHDLETVFVPVPELKDALEAVPAKGDEPLIAVSGLPVAGKREDNLVWKAYKKLRARYPDKVPALDWYLHKAIPMGAGLGGGSADGAYALRLLNSLCELNMPEDAMATLALELGSDCPFFLHDTPCFASGRGEKLSPVSINLSGYTIKVVPSSIHVSTGKAFSLLKPHPAPFDLRGLPELPVQEWRERIGNDFEGPVFSMHPELRKAKEQLYAEGALYAQMSGSGSAVYGVFVNPSRG
jgi:4-diphosphocytidyl-2-C-methyl-D-erythritol kinase